MGWLYLILAGMCELSWPVGLKLITYDPKRKFIWITLVISSMTIGGIFLFLAQITIPIGTAYAIWTGIGAAGTFIIGVIWFNDRLRVAKMLSVILIISGIFGLKLTEL